MPTNTSVHPTIKLDPLDWHWATWRPYTPLPRPPVPAFDPVAARERLKKVRPNSYFSWEPLHLSPMMSREEAQFWLIGMAFEQDRKHSANHLATFLAEQHFDGDLTVIGIEKLLMDKPHWRSGAEMMIPLANLLSLTDLIVLMNRLRPGGYTVLAQGFREYLLPYLTPDERNIVRDAIREYVTNAPTIPSQPHQRPTDFNLYVAAAVGGFSRELETRLAALPDDFYRQKQINPYSYHYLAGIDLIFGFDDPALVERETRRLGHGLCNADHIAGWLAHTETKALDWVYESLLITHKTIAEPLFRVFAKVEDEAVVPYMLHLQHNSPLILRSLEWLKSHPEIGAPAAASLVTAENTDPKTSREARDYLLSLKRAGLLKPVQLADAAAQARYQAEILDVVDIALPVLPPEHTPAWLANGVAEVQKGKRTKLPTWLDAGELPPLRLGDYAFNRDQVTALLVALSRSTLDQPHPFVMAVKQHLELTHRETWAWALFQLWLERSAPTKDKWALLAVGLLGGDASVMNLTPLIRKWPGENQHQRAITGLNCLRAIGTDTALTQINNIGQKVQFKALKEAARKAIEAIAAERNLSREELADRIVPDCGLDEHGQRTFDYGARQFTLVITAELKPVIRGADGKLKPDLPKPTTQDDPELAAIAQADWKLIRKQVRDVAKLQAERLEAAMMARRLWNPSDFKSFLVDHPLMTHLVRALVWGGYDENRDLRCTFRVTDEKDYANIEDNPISLAGVARVGLVHPLQLSEGEIAQWGQVLSDYDRVSPFTQLSRKTYTLNADEIDATEITRYTQHKIEAVVLVGVLQKLGWIRGEPGDGGVYYEHARPFPENGVTAILQYPGVWIGYSGGGNEQTLDRCFFVSGVYKPNYAWPEHKSRLKLGSVDRVVMSEVLRDLALLSHKSIEK